MRPFQLKRHFEKEHANYTDQDTSLFQRKAEYVKRSRINATRDLFDSSKSAVEAYYIVEDIKIQFVEQIKEAPIGWFAFNWMNPRMLHHVLNFLF